MIPNNTFVTLSVDVTNNKLFNLDPNARVELVVTPISDGSVEVKKEVQENKFIFNSYSSNISERFRLKIIQDSEKQKEVDFKVTSIKVTFKGTEYNITQDIYKYFGETTPSITVMVKKFTLR
ncbi:hypothetical protein [Thermobrachium celere]|uniref:hypothetical protein n=1 Tax=Thermobrachium celere TaxID=53422 RepID=UPI00194285C8|nr:hypothetical protein [Thermobrachium celere]GFR36639.1 hypothetical protein TCEA9_24510 [Thermobrachium celere]